MDTKLCQYLGIESYVNHKVGIPIPGPRFHQLPY